MAQCLTKNYFDQFFLRQQNCHSRVRDTFAYKLLPNMPATLIISYILKHFIKFDAFYINLLFFTSRSPLYGAVKIINSRTIALLKKLWPVTNGSAIDPKLYTMWSCWHQCFFLPFLFIIASRARNTLNKVKIYFSAVVYCKSLFHFLLTWIWQWCMSNFQLKSAHFSLCPFLHLYICTAWYMVLGSEYRYQLLLSTMHLSKSCATWFVWKCENQYASKFIFKRWLQMSEVMSLINTFGINV